MKRRIFIALPILAAVAIGAYFLAAHRPRSIILTGIVATDPVIVSPEIPGRIEKLLVERGDPVTNSELLATIQPKEWKADMAFYASSEQQSAAQVAQAKADLNYQEAQTSNQISQARATFAAAQAQVAQAKADAENARLNFQRIEDLYHRGVESAQAYDQARTGNEAAQARVESLRKQAQAARAAVAVAEANLDQVAARRAALQANIHHLAAAGAQTEKARVQLNYTEVHAPISGIVDTRAALQGEVVNAGQPILTLINPNNLWVRADVPETYIDRIRLGEKMTVRLPSGAKRVGTVFYRGVDADYATQRDVSRTKRDIKTFEIRLRCDNEDRRLAVGMTAYVTLPLAAPQPGPAGNGR